MKYLTVGTDKIEKRKFIPISDNDNQILKPNGGMWFTKYYEEYKNYNEWVDFIIDNPNLLFYKSNGIDIWHQPCSVISLNNNTNMFTLDSFDNWLYLLKEFSYNQDKFSYQKLSKEFDCIYVDIKEMISDIKDEKVFKFIRQFGVNSLLLFNLDCIDYYQSGKVSISPFDLEYHEYEDISYEIEIGDIKKRILK